MQDLHSVSQSWMGYMLLRKDEDRASLQSTDQFYIKSEYLEKKNIEHAEIFKFLDNEMFCYSL